jgi:hypothetical protein
VGYDFEGWFAAIGPNGLPEPEVKRRNSRSSRKAWRGADEHDLMASQRAPLLPGTPNSGRPTRNLA